MKIESCLGVLLLGTLIIAVPAICFIIPQINWLGVLILGFYAFIVIEFIVENCYIHIHHKIVPESVFNEQVDATGSVLGWMIALAIVGAGLYLVFRFF